MTKQFGWMKFLLQHDLKHQRTSTLRSLYSLQSLNSFISKYITTSRGIKLCGVSGKRIRNNYSTNGALFSTYYETLTRKKQTAASGFIESLLASKTISREDAKFLKGLDKSDTCIELLYRDSVANRNLIKCRIIHKTALKQKDWSLAYGMLLNLSSTFERFSERENIILCKMITDSLTEALHNSAFEFYYQMRFKFRYKLIDRQVGKLLCELLKSEVIELDMFLELMLNEHYILSEKEASLVIDLCHRDGKLHYARAEVGVNQATCGQCGRKLQKDVVSQSDFKDTLKDFVEKMEYFYAERDICTLYFESLNRFLQTNGPFDICIDAENLYIDKKQFLKTIHTVSKTKRIFFILSSTSPIAELDLPTNVTCFRVKSFAFRGQDDILTLLSILLNGPETILISNDGYRDIIMMLKGQGRATLQRWQRINQWPFTFDDNYNTILFPKVFSRSAQKSENGWHIPYRSDTMSRHQAGFLCIQKHNWVPSNTVIAIKKARQKFLDDM